MVDQNRINSLSERIMKETNAAFSCLNLYLGHKLNLFKTISEAAGGSITPTELAKKTGCSERYIREWLESMAVGKYLEYDSKTGRFILPEEHAVVFLDQDNLSYTIPFVYYVPSFASIIDKLIVAFRSGGGVPFESYGRDTVEAIGVGNRPMFVNWYVQKWIPAMPDIERRLKHHGGLVADIGCGTGWSSIAIAQGFSKTRIDAIDVDPASIEVARRNANDVGVSAQIAFHLSPIEDFNVKNGADKKYDLITAFECIHDMPYPVKALEKIHEMVAPDGAVLVADELVGETVEENNNNFLGQLYYNFSVLHCLPQAMVYPDSAATGAVMPASKLKGYAKKAGFSRVDILPIDNPLWRFYRLSP
ncbi:MAG TPA: class I SAM-dependent methyltransferase [Nitrososphaera sp.]|nr:class I SAM-dependent methyltransferase [Nitrososphaera sp.]